MQFVRTANDYDARTVADRLRQADRDEIIAATGKDPLFAVFDSLDASVFAVTVLSPHGEPIALGGIVQHPTDPLVGIIWLVASQAIFDHPIWFLRQSRRFLPNLLKVWPVLTNAADERNTAHLNWLTWLGATFTKRIPEFGFEGRPFQEFVLCASR